MAELKIKVHLFEGTRNIAYSHRRKSRMGKHRWIALAGEANAELSFFTAHRTRVLSALVLQRW